MKKNDEGFTLIELLIVIVILGILATVVVFAVAGIRDKGDASACETERRSVETAIEAYYADTGDYPDAGWDPSSEGDNKYMRSTPTYWSVGDDGTLVGTAENPNDCVFGS